jgi:hypothetical protein
MYQLMMRQVLFLDSDQAHFDLSQRPYINQNPCDNDLKLLAMATNTKINTRVLGHFSDRVLGYSDDFQ